MEEFGLRVLALRTLVWRDSVVACSSVTQVQKRHCVLHSFGCESVLLLTLMTKLTSTVGLQRVMQREQRVESIHGCRLRKFLQCSSISCGALVTLLVFVFPFSLPLRLLEKLPPTPDEPSYFHQQSLAFVSVFAAHLALSVKLLWWRLGYVFASLACAFAPLCTLVLALSF